MKQKNKWVDPLERIIKDHEYVLEYDENLEKILSLGAEEDGSYNIEQIKDFFNRSIVSHFKFEEKVIFPPISSKVASAKFKKLVLELQKEHKIILKELDEFQKIVSGNKISFDEQIKIEINIMVRKIMDRLQRHALKEDEELLPIIEGNKDIFS
jgi:iron-sulfur cluster repair protein YtfE (RIC family)